MTPSGCWSRSKLARERKSRNRGGSLLGSHPGFHFGDVLVTLVRNRRFGSTFHTQNTPFNSSQATT